MRLLLAATLAVVLACFEFGWRVELPPLPRIVPSLHAAGEEPEDCPIVGKAGSATVLYRCDDWAAGKVCYLNNFGFLFCMEE